MADIHLNSQVPNAASLSSSKCSGSSTDAAHAVSKEQRLAKACADFEAIFVEQLFKTMRASVPESGLADSGRAEEIYTSMLDQQIAREMALGQGSLGLAQQMRSTLDPEAIGKTVLEMKD
jgi:Rod binding domain-containing protein